MSSASAYHYLLNKLKVNKGLAAKSLAEQAYKADPYDPLALTLYGSILFEAPKIIGGNKPLARKLFLRADSIYKVAAQPNDTVHRTFNRKWNWQRISLNTFLDKSRKY